MMPVLGDFATVGTTLSALADEDFDTRIVVRTDAGQYLFIREIVVDAMHEHHRVDESVIALPAEYVVLVVAPQKPRPAALPDSPRIRCDGGSVALDYASATYLVACLDVLSRLAADRYGRPPRPPFGAFRNALNTAAAELALVSAGTTNAAASDDAEFPRLVGNEPMSSQEVAAVLEIGESGVRDLCRRGRLQATKFGRAWAVSAASVAAYKASRKRREVA
jgi:excisionase family DNA binding protein